jgi:hypothetical protein
MNDDSTQSEAITPLNRREDAEPAEPGATKKPPLHEQKETKPSMLWMLVPLLLVGLAILLSR